MWTGSNGTQVKVNTASSVVFSPKYQLIYVSTPTGERWIRVLKIASKEYNEATYF